jgi:hypothetical protein
MIVNPAGTQEAGIGTNLFGAVDQGPATPGGQRTLTLKK